MSFKGTFKVVLGVFLFVIIFFGVAPFLHESGHAIAAVMLGVPFKELRFRFGGLGPHVTVPSYVSEEFLVYFRYAGGLFAGIVLLIIYVLYSFWQTEAYTQSGWWSKFRWWLGLIIIVPSGYNLLYGYLEGAHFEDYVTGKLPSMIQVLAALLFPVIIHLALTMVLIRRNPRTS
jgi:hypothetical protein